MVGHSRGVGRGRPNGRACYHSEYPPHEDAQDALDPPYYVQDLNKQRSLDDVKKMPEDYRHPSTNEPLYHQPPTPLETQDRYQGGCVTGEVPGLVAAGGNSLTSPYFAQHQLRMGQGSGRRFSPLRLPLGASRSSWRGCSWRCTTVVFVCVTLCLATTTTFFATSQVGRWHSPEGCQDSDVSSTSAHNQPVHRQPATAGNLGLPPSSPEAPSVSSLSSMSVGVGRAALAQAHTPAHPTGMHLPPVTAPHVSVDPSGDDLHVDTSSLMDVSQELSAGGVGPAIRVQRDVDRSPSDPAPSAAVSRTPSAPEDGRRPRVSGSTGNKLSTLDTTSPGIDLGAGEGRQPLLTQPAAPQEELIPLNHENGVADNTQEEPETFVAHDPAAPRRVRSAPDHETGLRRLLPSRTLSPRRLSLLNLVYASAPPPSAYNSSSPTLTSGNAPSGATAGQPTDVPASSVSGAGAQLPSGASSTVLMNNPDTLGIGAAHGQHPQSTTSGSETAHYVITATAATTALGMAPADGAAGDTNHTTPLTDGENVILEERWSSVLVSREGVLSPDHTAAPTSGVLEETPPLGNASLHDYEYQVTPETVATPRILPSFLEATPALAQHGASHSQPTDDLQSLATTAREGHADIDGVEVTPRSTHRLTETSTTETTAAQNTPSAPAQPQLPHSSEASTAADQIHPDPLPVMTQASAYDQTTRVLGQGGPIDHSGAAVLDLPSPVDVPPSSTVLAPVRTPIMTDASTGFVDSALSRDRRLHPPGTISATVASTTDVRGVIKTNEATQATVDPSPAATTTAGAAAAETAAQQRSTTATSASPTKPLSDEPIKPGRLEPNNTNIADFRWGSGANHSEDGIIPKPQVAPTISHKVGPEQGEGQAPSEGAEKDHSTKLFSPYEDSAHREGADFQRPGTEVAATIKNSTPTHLQEGHQKPVFSALRIIDAVDAEEREDKDVHSEGSFQESSNVAREHGGMWNTELPGEGHEFQKQDHEMQHEDSELRQQNSQGGQEVEGTEEEERGRETRQHDAEAQQADQSSQVVIDHSQDTVSVQGADDVPALVSPTHTLSHPTPTTAAHGHKPTDRLDTASVVTPAHLLSQEERRRESTQETHEGLPGEEGQIPMISTSRGEYNVRDEGERREDPPPQRPETTAGVQTAREDASLTSPAGEDAIGGEGVSLASATPSLLPGVNENIQPYQNTSLPASTGRGEVNIDSRMLPSEAAHLMDGQTRQSPGNATESQALPGISTVITTNDHTRPGDTLGLPGASLASSQEENETGDTGEDSLNNESEGRVEVTPFSDIDTPPDAQVSNRNSYEGASGSLALPVIGDLSLHKTPAAVMGEQAGVGITAIDGIGINDVAAKDQRDKTTNRISLPGSNQTGETATKSLPLPTTHTSRNVILPDGYKRQKSIESLGKQSAPGSREASARPGYGERKESSIDTRGSEANQGHSFLSRSNQVVRDPNHESVHAQVSSRDPVEENREDQNPSVLIWSNRNVDVAGDMMSSDEYDYDGSYSYHPDGSLDYDAAEGDEDYEERNNSHGDEAEEDDIRHEGIEEDERDLERIPGGSLDPALEGSLLDQGSDTGNPGWAHATHRLAIPATTHLLPAHVREDLPAQVPPNDDEGSVSGLGSHVSTSEGRLGEVEGSPHSDSGSSSSNSSYGNSNSSSHGSSSHGSVASNHSIMPPREPWQSQDSPCKCSCQCDGGENPPITPGRVESNLNFGAGAQGEGQGPDLASTPAHRHRHHHGGTRGGSHAHGHTTLPLPSHTPEDIDTRIVADAHTPTPPLETHSTSPVVVHEAATPGGVHEGGAEGGYVTSNSVPSTEGVVVIRQRGYTIVSEPAVTHVMAVPDTPHSGSTTPTLVPTTTAAIPEGATIHATLNLASSSGGAVRPQQVAPPDGASFSALALGEEVAFTLAPYGYWNLHLTLNDPTDLRITLTIPRGTSLGLYARRSALPTHTQHDIMKILRGTRQRDVRASPSMVEVTVEEVLEAGEWFLSIYNDDGDPHQVALVISRSPGGGECPQLCHDRGHCILGRCQCESGYSGIDCSQVLCPILCSGHGDYVNGQCRCHPGFKGKECQLRHHECEVPDCNGQGQCVDGQCHCAKGFTGEFCQTVDCPHPTCSGNGWCVMGTCVCEKGWLGPECSATDVDARQCFPDCNNHGAFDIELRTCVCHKPWTGSDCSKKSCSLDCGLHGVCENDACTCHEGWRGDNCSEKLCDPRCSEHGQCKNGTCVCMTGWNGRHCTLSGCPGNCRNRGTCEASVDRTWYCRCETGWDGPDCSTMLETQCNDGMDNDRDGLKDCQDPECCTHQACLVSQMCVSQASSPIDILLRKQPPAATASFFEKMKFLIEEDSLQHFTTNKAFNRRRAAVVRGRVVTRAGRGVVGFRVSTSENLEGFTLTRRDGWFDMMVNGGGAVTLSFGKPPFSHKTIRVMVPWNEVVVLDDIVMTVPGTSSVSHRDDYHDHPQRHLTSHCPPHDYDLLRPVVMATWQNVFQGECPDVDAILVESQAVQESIQIPGTGMYLVYHSSRASGYESTIRMQLTPDHIPATLRRIHLRIVLEGTLFTRVFEADPNIKFTYAWNRYNVYRQRVHGVTVARVSVGYEHSSCPETIWEHQTVRVAGNDLSISRVGGFNLHIHHAYNYHQGILQKGDGQNIYLAGQRRLVTTLLGTAEQREVNCGERCEGTANLSPLLAPTCLAAAPDGSLYVGDFNLIRRVKPDGTVITVARLNETRVSYRYHVAVSPLDGSVYVSDPEAHQVLKLEQTQNVSDTHHNTIAVVGSGQRCLPGDRMECGDGGNAIHARLTYPKGLAISSSGDIYIADGTNIRVVNPSGTISTVIGGHDHRSHWAPVPCNGTINMDQLHLRWPTELAISPLDGSLHILDDHLVLRVTPDSRVQVLSGRSLNCPTPVHDPPDVSRTALLLNPQSIAFSPQGELYVAESDTQRINRVRIITNDGRISTFAGADSRCNCRDPTCYCHTYDNVSASSAIFSSISSIAVTPDGVLHISDQAGYRVRSVRTVLPELNVRKQYEIFSPDAHEVYIFNRYGQHVQTRNLVTGQTIYTFSYSINSSAGRLLTVKDGAGNRFQLIRNYFGDVTAIENPQKQRLKIRLSMMKMLEQLVVPDGYNITFHYHGASELMRSKIETVGRSYNYNYDEQGRLTQAVLPTGQVIQLTFDLSTRGAEVIVTRDGKNPVRTRVRGNTLTHNAGPVEAVADMGGEGQLRVVTEWDHEVSLERTSYRVLESTSQIAAEMFPILSRQQTHISGELVNRYEWMYSPASHHSNGLGMKVAGTLRVNGADLLTLSYDPVSSSEALLSVSGQMLINITYDSVGRPVRWVPVSPLVPSNVSYDHWGHITGWTRGSLSEKYHYDDFLRLKSIVYADGAAVNYDYRDKLTPEKMTHPSGNAYGLVYDDAGSLRQVVTPRGSAYTFHLSTSLGFYRLRLALPVDSIALQIRLDERGRLLAMTQPGHGGTLLYQYNDLGQVTAERYGHGCTEYTYYDTGLIHIAKTKHRHEDVKTDYRYHAGLMKEMRLRYGSKSDLHNVKLRYQYDGSARLRKLEGEINSAPLSEVYIRFDNQTGVLQLISDLRIIRNNILETMLQNPKKHYVNTRKQDDYGRLAQIIMTLKGRTVFMMQLKYDNRNRISERLIAVSGRWEGLNITYTDDGQIRAAAGTHTWLYSYDDNGNIISNTDKGQTEKLIYDECDRVTVIGENEVEYDERGFVISVDNQNFDYNTKGQLVSAWDRVGNWSFTLGYDHLGRVSVYRGHNNSATQIIYGRPDLPELITHLHNPHTGTTTSLLYDDMNHLIAIDQPDGRYFVASDQNGMPVAIFDDMGSVICSQVWSPFGYLVDYVCSMWVVLGPWGMFREPETGLLLFGSHAYHPKLLQWMTPRWGHLTQPTRHVTDVYVYRFMNNNPFNPQSDRMKHYYTDVSDWLQLYGIELGRVLGSEYHENTLVATRPVVAVDDMGASEVVSGLWCQYRAGVRHLHDLSFFSQSHIQHRMGMWNGAPISRQASIFGPGVLVSDVEDRVLVTDIGEDDFSGVIGDVIRTVLNNSIVLDVSATHNGLDTFYFIKNSRNRAIEDMGHLQRLSGIFNVTNGETDHGHEIRMSTPMAYLVILYGERVQRARSRILGELERQAEEMAWAREAALVSLGRPNTHTWSAVEAAELLREGRVPGYVATHLHSPSRYPLLAADASNIVFKHESSRKRRKSRRKGRKKGWRQRKKDAV